MQIDMMQFSMEFLSLRTKEQINQYFQSANTSVKLALAFDFFLMFLWQTLNRYVLGRNFPETNVVWELVLYLPVAPEILA